MDLKHHLVRLGLNADLICESIPEYLTLSLADGVLFVCDDENPNLTVQVDFINGPMAYRASQHIGGEHLIKACKLKAQSSCHILDATCGMGKDSFLLYKAGHTVTATEQNLVVHALLSDGLYRYVNKTNESGFKLLQEDALSVMNSQSFDVIYLDPMFPDKTKSAKAKKDMQLFQKFHHQAEDNAHQLLAHALTSDCQRVVIKRPIQAKPLIQRKPTFQIVGKTCRFEAFQLG